MRGLPVLPYGLSDARGDLPAASLRQLHNVLAVLRWVGLVWVGLRAVALNTPFLTTDLLVWSLFYTYGAVAITAVDRILVRGREARETTIPRPVATIAPMNGAALRLSQREHEVLRLVAEGYSNTMIATRLHLSESTVKTHVEALLARLNARNRAEAVAAASRLQLL